MRDVVIIPSGDPLPNDTAGTFKLIGQAIEADNNTLIGWDAGITYNDTAAQKNSDIVDAVVSEFSNISITVGAGDRKDILGGF